MATRRRSKAKTSDLPEVVMKDLKDTLHAEIDLEKVAAESAVKVEKSIGNENAINTQKGEVSEARGATEENSVQPRAKTIQSTAVTVIKPLRPYLKDTRSSRSSSSSFAKAAAEATATAKLEESVANEIAINTPKGEEDAKENVTEAKGATAENSVEPRATTIHATAATAIKPLRPHSRDARSPRPQDSPASSKTSVKDRIRNANAKASGSVRDRSRSVKGRIQKFQTGGKENANATGFQMIGLQTLGFVSNKVPVSSYDKKDDDSVSTTYSFFCSNDEDSEYESDSESEYDDSDDDTIFDSVHVIAPDLTPIEIEIDSAVETLADIKTAVAEASGIPIDDLRLAIHSDTEKSNQTHLDDDFKLSPGDILWVDPATVVVKLPDGNSKLELSVFPGTLLSDIKDYIAKSTGTTPSRQLLYSFERNFDEELEDDAPIATDCILRLTVY